MKLRNLLKIYKAKTKLYLKTFIDRLLPWSLYSKFSINRNFYKKSDDRYKIFSLEDRFVNLGAGSYFFHPRWDCLDFYRDGMNKVHKNYINWDFTQKKNLPHIYKLAYCSHVIEHILQKDIKDFFQIIYDALAKDGIFRITVPDADAAYEAYSEGDIDYFSIYSSRLNNVHPGYEIEYLLLFYFATSKVMNNSFNKTVAEEIRYKFKNKSKEEFLDFLIKDIEKNSSSGMEHVNWFNFDKAERLLKEIGFKKVYRSEFGKSKTPVMRDVPLFDSWLPSISLYIEACK
ncbi:MAG: hypothetical protein JJ846_007955 [Prochlorococcus marinus CUG1437]|nr:hypothetical protein [Prochlorococcus marinus CUG1437]